MVSIYQIKCLNKELQVKLLLVNNIHLKLEDIIPLIHTIIKSLLSFLKKKKNAPTGECVNAILKRGKRLHTNKPPELSEACSRASPKCPGYEQAPLQQPSIQTLDMQLSGSQHTFWLESCCPDLNTFDHICVFAA